MRPVIDIKLDTPYSTSSVYKDYDNCQAGSLFFYRRGLEHRNSPTNSPNVYYRIGGKVNLEP
jgi:hypothetical protein